MMDESNSNRAPHVYHGLEYDVELLILKMRSKNQIEKAGNCLHLNSNECR
jgi:hypothetical protein